MRHLAFTLMVIGCCAAIGSAFLFGSGKMACSKTACNCTSAAVNCSHVDHSELGRYPTDRLDYFFVHAGLTTLGSHNFSHLANMRYLSVMNNSIVTIGSKTFSENVKLETVYLSYNLIESLPDSLFNSNPLLEQFYCAYNHLTTISRFLFRGLTKLTHVRLHNNRLVSVHPDAFASLVKIDHLYLEYNRLETAYWQWIQNTSRLDRAELEFDNNPWSCDCRMAPFWHNVTKNAWMMAHTAGSSKCKHNCPLNLPECQRGKGKVPIVTLKKSDLTCSKSSLIQSASKTVVYKGVEGNSSTIVCNTTGFPLPNVTIYDELDCVIANGRGSASYTFSPVVAEEAGKYLCVMEGFDNHGGKYNVNATVNFVVQTTSGTSAGVILAILLAVIVVVGGVSCFWRKQQRRDGYGELANGGVGGYYELDDSQVVLPPTQTTQLEEENIFAEEETYSQGDGDKEVLV